MANGQIHEGIASDVLQQFNMPLSVSSMTKLQQFPMLQQLSFNGQLSSMNDTFHGVKDFTLQMDLYSSYHPILTAAWKLIKGLAPKNPSVTSLLFQDKALGKVGSLFKSIHGFGQVFGINPNPLPDISSLSNKVSKV